MITDLTYLLNTNSSSLDILHIHLCYMKKYLPHIQPTICIDNKDLIKDLDNIKEIIEYDNNVTFVERFRQIVSKVSTKYLLFAMDNNILVNSVADNFIEETIGFMDLHGADQVRFSPLAVSGTEYKSPYYSMTGGYFLSVWPSIWKTSSFLKLCTSFNRLTYRNFECDEVFSFVRTHFSSFYVSSEFDLDQNTDRIVSYHYPMIHLTRSGKWYTSHYKSYIADIIKEFNIDITIRGVFSTVSGVDF